MEEWKYFARRSVAKVGRRLEVELILTAKHQLFTKLSMGITHQSSRLKPKPRTSSHKR
jgi:hypothetical protein